MALLNQLGVDNIDFYPCCSPNEEYSQSIKFAVTPGESRYVRRGSPIFWISVPEY